MQIQSAERAFKVRTYNFPQDRITDHRLNTSLYDCRNFMTGNLMKTLYEKLAEKEEEDLVIEYENRYKKLFDKVTF